MPVDFCPELLKITAICLMGGRRKPVHSPPLPPQGGSSLLLLMHWNSQHFVIKVLCKMIQSLLGMGKQKSREGERGDPSTSELGRPRAHEGRNLPRLLRCVRGRPGPARHLEGLALGPQHLLRPGYRQFSLGGLTRLSSSDHPLKVNAPPNLPSSNCL